MLPCTSLSHWSYSDWRYVNNPPPPQKFDPNDPTLTPARFDYYTRMSMLNRFGFSQPLPELPAWMNQQLAKHINVYQTLVRPFLSQGQVARLTKQPLRKGGATSPPSSGLFSPSL